MSKGTEPRTFHSLLTIPNLVTLLRLLLAPFVATAILNGSYPLAIGLFFAAGITDIVDGLLARKMGDTTRFGAYLDPIADKILLSVIYLSLAVVRDIPWWMVGVVFGRDLLILAMAAYGLLFTSIRKFPPSVWGKISTFFQISAALMVMCARAGLPAPVKLAIWLMLAATLWSGVHYAWRGVAQLRLKSD